jgi:DNA-binding transcriptional regulator YiaG
MTGVEVYERRMSYGLSQAKFAKELKLSHSLVEKWENGDRAVKENHAAHIDARFPKK